VLFTAGRERSSDAFCQLPAKSSTVGIPLICAREEFVAEERMKLDAQKSVGRTIIRFFLVSWFNGFWFVGMVNNDIQDNQRVP
jgi:hypothetical protein